MTAEPAGADAPRVHVDADDDAAAYDVEGPADGPAIVFVHGTRLSRAMWRPQMDALRDSYRVIALDLPGHGALAEHPFTIVAAGDQVARVIEDTAGGPAVVVGLSLGGYVAMDLAARRPELVRGLVLSGASTEPVGGLAAPFLALAWAMETFDGPALDALNAWFFRTRFAPAVAEPIIAGGFWSAGGAQALRAIVGKRFAPRLAAYPGPTLILNGEFDPLFRLTVKRFAGAARNGRRVRLRGATHLANLDRPGAFNLAIRRFVEGLQGPQTGRAGGPERGPVLDLATHSASPDPHPPRFDARP
ncbi:MAG TPA: alpha/beta hydrolase [Methylomirabilota bacterium]|nr:alpha/beta hydrolase [Methylomirabilota bacterium]